MKTRMPPISLVQNHFSHYYRHRQPLSIGSIYLIYRLICGETRSLSSNSKLLGPVTSHVEKKPFLVCYLTNHIHIPSTSLSILGHINRLAPILGSLGGCWSWCSAVSSSSMALWQTICWGQRLLMVGWFAKCRKFWLILINWSLSWYLNGGTTDSSSWWSPCIQNLHQWRTSLPVMERSCSLVKVEHSVNTRQPFLQFMRLTRDGRYFSQRVSLDRVFS